MMQITNDINHLNTPSLLMNVTFHQLIPMQFYTRKNNDKTSKKQNIINRIFKLKNSNYDSRN